MALAWLSSSEGLLGSISHGRQWELGNPGSIGKDIKSRAGLTQASVMTLCSSFWFLFISLFIFNVYECFVYIYVLVPREPEEGVIRYVGFVSFHMHSGNRTGSL